MGALHLEYTVAPDDFSRAGEVSGIVKRTLKDLGFPPAVVRRTAIAMYEAEINMVIHANGGKITADITPEEIMIVFADQGPGIPDINLAMQEGWSTASEDIRDMGFGAGMGLPNIQKSTDYMDVQTTVGVGTTITIKIFVTQ
ncbi:MAG: ATP-binding protein [Oscillospiraceae bacterium]|nr:ATP-binding protein [Oscillospiraceae bacterium]